LQQLLVRLWELLQFALRKRDLQSIRRRDFRSHVIVESSAEEVLEFGFESGWAGVRKLRGYSEGLVDERARLWTEEGGDVKVELGVTEGLVVGELKESLWERWEVGTRRWKADNWEKRKLELVDQR
jgi:hypothetical protein